MMTSNPSQMSAKAEGGATRPAKRARPAKAVTWALLTLRNLGLDIEAKGARSWNVRTANGLEGVNGSRELCQLARWLLADYLDRVAAAKEAEVEA